MAIFTNIKYVNLRITYYTGANCREDTVDIKSLIRYTKKKKCKAHFSVQHGHDSPIL